MLEIRPAAGPITKAYGMGICWWLDCLSCHCFLQRLNQNNNHSLKEA